MIAWTMPDALELLTTRRSFKAVELAGPVPSLDALGLAPHERIAGFIHIGRPPGSPEDRPRPPLNEIAVRFTA